MLCFLVLKCVLCWLHVISHLKQLFNSVFFFDLVQLPDAHPAPLSLPLVNRTGGEYRMKKLMGGDRLEEKITIMGKTDLT